jgi:sulfopyruvate decarboxylase subunit beta
MATVNKTAAIAALIACTADEPVLFTTGYACRIARGLRDRPNHFYMLGSMGLACSVGIGLALQSGRTTVVVDGDGSLWMSPVGLMLAGSLRPRLVHVVLDDGSYASTGGQAVPVPATDLGRWAEAAGYPSVVVVRELPDLERTLRAALVDCTGPVMVHCMLSGPDQPVPPRVDVDLAQHAAGFGRTVQAMGQAAASRSARSSAPRS